MIGSHRSPYARRKLAALIGASTLLASCGGGSGADVASTTGSTSTTTASTAATSATSAVSQPATTATTSAADHKAQAKLACAGEGQLDLANFVSPTLDTNQYHPLKPGTQWVRGGSTLVGGREVPYQVTSTMSDVIHVIDGVPTIAMLDESEDSGEIAQTGIDYLALDRDGNVWLLGGYTEDYEGGQYTNTEDHWLGTAGKARVGVLAPAVVAADTPVWCIGGDADEEPSVGSPVKIGVSECVKFGCFNDVRVVEEGQSGAPDNEQKYYAAGVGVIRNVPLNASLHKDRFELLNLVLLSPEGLAEASQRVLKLEAHARKTAPQVFGRTPESKRAGA